ncbi:MAG: GNAT family N-acetyltransferase [Dissulfurispiraceae bacterium]|jgi:hypothetical protein|nr:GNAT family N-acetyltransferase [Dissulfurispiraceae bacterium]
MTTEIIELNEALKNQEIYDKWLEYALNSKNLFSMYGAPDFLSGISDFSESVKVVVHRTDAGIIDNIFPYRITEKTIDILSIKHLCINLKKTVADLICCDPYGVIKSENFKRMFEAVLSNDPKICCIYIKSVQLGSDIFKAIMRSTVDSKKLFLHLESGQRDFHTLYLDKSFDDYLSKFKRKERYNLKRQIRLADKASEGNLVLKRIEQCEDVDCFFNCARTVLRNSWKADTKEEEIIFSKDRCDEYFALAKKGILRSYLLISNNEPWAFVLGIQWNGIFHYANIAYSFDKSDFSPGSILFYLMLEDLHAYNKPKALNFGICDAFYKKRFGTARSFDSSVLIMRNSIKSRMISVMAVSARKLKSILKQIIAGKVKIK